MHKKNTNMKMTKIHSRTVAVFLAIAGLALGVPACVADDDGIPAPRNLPVLRISDVTVQEGDVDDTLRLAVRLVGLNATNVVFAFGTSEATASSPSDYKILTAGSMIFGVLDTLKFIDILIKADEAREPVEKLVLKFFNPVNGTIENDRITVTIEDDDDNLADLVIPAGGSSSPEAYPGYTLVWRDEFEGDVVDPANWSFDIGDGCPNLCGWGNNELEYYRQENTDIMNGYLVITAKRQAFGGRDFTSSRLITKGKRQFKFGRVDIRAALPEGRGIWPATWMLGSNIDAVSWPACGEIDIMELTGDRPDRVVGTVHFGENVSAHQFISANRFAPAGQSYQDEFHVYSINWEANLIQFMVDNEVYHTITPASLAGAPYPFNKAFFFIFNLAVGGNWPGSPDNSTRFPQHLIVDYIRVFQK